MASLFAKKDKDKDVSNPSKIDDLDDSEKTELVDSGNDRLKNALRKCKDKLARWQIKGNVSITMTILAVSLGVSIDIDRIEKAKDLKEKDKQPVLDAEDWGNMEVDNVANQFILLKSDWIHDKSGIPRSKAMSSRGMMRKVETAMEKMKENMIKTCQKLQDLGVSGSLSASYNLAIPKILTFGEEVGMCISVTIPFVELFANMKLTDVENEKRSKGELKIVPSGVAYPKNVDGIPNDPKPYAIFYIEGGKSKDRKRTKVPSRDKSSRVEGWAYYYEWKKGEQEPIVFPCAPEGETLICSLYSQSTIGADDFIDEFVIPLDKLKIKPSVETGIVCPLKGNYKDSNIFFHATYTLKK